MDWCNTEYQHGVVVATRLQTHYQGLARATEKPHQSRPNLCLTICNPDTDVLKL